MEKLPDGFVDYNRLKLIIAILEYEYGIDGETQNVIDSSIEASSSSTSTATPYKRAIPSWMTAFTATGSAAKTPMAKKTKLF